MERKRCPKCGETKRIADFYKDSSKSSGLQSYCKKCVRIARERNTSIHSNEWYRQRDLSQPKSCSRCGKELTLADFYHHRKMEDGFAYTCKECAAERDRKKYASLHTPKWYKEQDLTKPKQCLVCHKWLILADFNHERGTKDGFAYTCKQCVSADPKRIYRGLHRRKNCHLTVDEFKDWYINEPKICCHCGILEKHLEYATYIPKKYRLRLEIERIKNKSGYRLGNIALACRACNHIHVHGITFEHTNQIGQKYFKPMWQKILMKKGIGVNIFS